MAVAISLTKRDIQQVERIIRELKQRPYDLDVMEKTLAYDDIDWLIKKAQIVFAYQPMLLEIEAPICVLGDTHGQFNDLRFMFEKGKWPPKTVYLFLGDYIDRGPCSVEVICLMFAFKVRYWNRFHVLRGNHETASINKAYGFYDEVTRKYNKQLYDAFNNCFDWMPLAALISDSILCMHGGISAHMKNVDDINKIPRPLREIEKNPLAVDLLWADPDANIQGYKISGRGISSMFGKDAIFRFLRQMNITTVVRAHQVVEAGCDWFEKGALLTVFSAPNYCNQINNCAGFVDIDKHLMLKLMAFQSRPPESVRTSQTQGATSSTSTSASASSSAKQQSQ